MVEKLVPGPLFKKWKWNISLNILSKVLYNLFLFHVQVEVDFY